MGRYKIDAIAMADADDLVIVAASGHNRPRDWLGRGIRRALFHPERYCALLAHEP